MSRRGPSLALFGAALLAGALAAQAETLEIPGLSAPATVKTDALGVPHIEAQTLADAVRVQGFVHARDRFFQMDLFRRQARGTSAELTGSLLDLAADTQARLLGLVAAAERDVERLTPALRALLQAYADGVNAWLAMHPLPAEYAELELSRVEPWSVLDVLTIAKAGAADAGTRLWELFDTEDLAAYQAAGAAQGFDGTALFVEDVARFAPMVPVATVPGGGAPILPLAPAQRGALTRQPPGAALARRHRERSTAEAERVQRSAGSNVWGVAAGESASGGPLVANDAHGVLSAPARLYEVHIRVENDPAFGPLNLAGAGVAGVPAIGRGENEALAWGATTFWADAADYFADRLVRGDPACPARLCIDSAGLHPVEERSERYFRNPLDGTLDNPLEVTAQVAANPAGKRAVHVLRVPFRSFGPVLELTDASVADDPGATPGETEALTLQWAGLHGTRDAEALFGFLTAGNVAEFEAAARLLSALTTHQVVGDRDGHLAYFATGEIPLRADLEAGSPLDGGPWWVRDGSGPSNWVPDAAHAEGQSIPFAVLPWEEMPHLVDPPAGFVANANNDPLGLEIDNDPANETRPSSPGARYYLGSSGLDNLRVGRIDQRLQELLGEGEPLTVADMQSLQGDTLLMDAQLLVPFLVDAWGAAQEPGAPLELASFALDAQVAEAVGRVSAWDFTSPTGIPEGYDAADLDGALTPVVSPDETAASVAATIHGVWRAKLIDDVIVARLAERGVEENDYPILMLKGLHHLLAQDPFTGVGGSGIDFFPEPAGLEPEQRRDVVLLQALREALDLLASNPFAAAFANSTVQDDYRWGKLHRVSFAHPLDGGRDIPPAADFEDLAPGLPGVSRDGALETVNLGGQNAGAASPEAFVFHQSAVVRRVADVSPVAPGADGLVAFSSLPGGSSGDLESPLYASQLALWLTVDYHEVLVTADQIAGLPSEDAIAVAVGKEQRSCVQTANEAGAAVGKAQGKEDTACLAAAATGKEPDPQACLTADAKGKVAKARDKAAKSEGKKCLAGEIPVFGYAGTASAADAGAEASLALVEDLFGSNLNGVAIEKATDKGGAACQGELLKSAQAALETIWKEAGKAKKSALAGKKGAAPADSGIELQDALLQILEPSDKVAKALSKLEQAAAKKCGVGVSLAAAFPGRCKVTGATDDAAALGTCARERVLCRGCRSIGAMDALALPCDQLDDGQVDESCG